MGDLRMSKAQKLGLGEKFIYSSRFILYLVLAKLRLN